jgi:hypothetical protein
MIDETPCEVNFTVDFGLTPFASFTMLATVGFSFYGDEKKRQELLGKFDFLPFWKRQSSTTVGFLSNSRRGAFL